MKKLLMVVGAGASIDFGMPSVADIDKLFEEWALESYKLADNPTQSLYSYLKEKLTAYVIQNKRNWPQYLLNFESLLYTIQSLQSLVYDRQRKNYNNRLNPFIGDITLPKIIGFQGVKETNGDDLHHLQSWLVDELLRHLRDKCKNVSIEKTKEIAKLKQFISDLQSEFEIGIFNLNYDDIILNCAPNLNVGFDRINGQFDRKLFYQSNWNFCYHLHGSVHFNMKGDNAVEMHKIFWNDNLDSPFSQNSSGRNAIYTSEGFEHLTSSIVAGLDKANQILRDPFGAYYKQLDRKIYESDAILFIGYGFNDLHLNKSFQFVRTDPKIRKVAVIDFATDKEGGLQWRRDNWQFGLFTTFPFNGYEMGDGKSREPLQVSYFRKNKIMERSSNPKYPLAVWYNGLMSACDHVNIIMNELL